MSSETFGISLFITIMPAIVAFGFYALYRRRNGGKVSRDMFFLMGFLAVTLFYIFAPDPALTDEFYVSQGIYGKPLILMVISSLFLLVSIFYFKKYRSP